MKKAIIVLLVVLSIMPSFVAAVCECGYDPTFCTNADGDTCPSPAWGCAGTIYCVPFCTCPCTAEACICEKEAIVTYVPGFDISGVLYLFTMFTGVFLLLRMPSARRMLRRSSK